MTDDKLSANDELRLAQKIEAEHLKLVQHTRSVSDAKEPDSIDQDDDQKLARAKQILEVIERTRRSGPQLPIADADQAETNHDGSTNVSPAFSIGQTSESPEPGNDRGNESRQFDLPDESLRIGRFEVVRQIGCGGYGLVFLARDPQLERQVAVKIPRPEAVFTDELMQRFVREGKAAAALSHPHIVPIFETGIDGPICYIASEYIEGPTLAAWMSEQNNGIDPKFAAETIAGLADAVMHAHQNGVLHRDLKPTNVLLDAMQPRITDFGLAKLIDETGHQTRSSSVLGTPAYMSPEQAVGNRPDVGTATDIYSLGAVLYEMITGIPPFEGATILQTLQMVRDNEPVSPRQIHPEIPRDLEAICLKCLNELPSSRYSDAHELSKDLRRFLNQQPVMARPPTVAGRLSKWVRRNPVVAGLSMISLLLLGAALIAATVGWYQTTEALGRVTHARNLADQRYLETKQAIDEYYTEISENQLLKSPGMKPLRKELLANALIYYQKFVTERSDDEQLITELEEAYRKIAGIQNELGNSAEAAKNISAAMDLIDRQLAAAPDDLKLLQRKAKSLVDLADIKKNFEDPQSAVELIRSAMDLIQRLVSMDPQNLSIESLRANSFSVHSEVSRVIGQTDVAIESLERALDVQRDVIAAKPNLEQSVNDRRRMASWRNMLARLMTEKGNLERAAELEQMVTTELRAVLSQFPNSLSDQDSLGRSLGEQGRMKLMQQNPAEAVEYLQEASEIFEKLLLIHPQVESYRMAYSSSCSNLGVVHGMLGEPDRAEEYFEKAIQVDQRSLEANPNSIILMTNLANNRMNLGGCLAQQDKFDRAKAEITAAFPVYEKLVKRTPGNQVTQMRLAIAHHMVGQLNVDTHCQDAALAHLNTAIQTIEQLRREGLRDPRSGHPLLRSYELRARVFSELDQLDKAIQDLQMAVSIAQGSHQRKYQLNLTTSLARAGRIDQAMQLFWDVKPAVKDTDDLDFHLAQTAAMLSAAVAKDAESEDAKSRIEELLEVAINSIRRHQRGLVDSTNEMEQLRNSEDFEFLRGYDAFQRLLNELENADRTIER